MKIEDLWYRSPRCRRTPLRAGGFALTFLLPKLIGSRFRVQGSRFKGYKMLISRTFQSTVWNGHFHPLGETVL
ncbi:hypothetical protein D1AOALGA4SA_8156 [Olavius algarvensis Delta 1 endosymbiont]|nr:hypothetical protein D1AOALGA4SA_8156 [Olavius algarvensis Delta 1 endosymbiont]